MKANNKQKIIEAAQRLITVQGVEKTLCAISPRSRITTGAIIIT